MALDDEVLQNALLALYQEMEQAPMDKATYAGKMSVILDTQTKTAGVPASAVIVAVSGGSGAPAVGTPNPDPINIE